MKREMSVSGSFYPQRTIDLLRYFEHFTKLYDERGTIADVNAKAFIVPHAGYVYSGYTANIAYRIMQKTDIDTFVVIGPSHRVGFRGISLCEDNSYDTPFGEIQSDKNMVDELKQMFGLKNIIQHAEHSTEVQFPFIKHYIPHAKIVELIYGQTTPKEISQIIDFVLSNQNHGVIISTDLSHFHNLEDANKIDSICLKGVESLDIDILENGCEACGIKGIKAMVMSAKKLNLSPTLLDYRTSANTSNDTSRVVGYMSAYFA